MEIVFVILVILGGLLLFTVFGLLGWALKGLDVVFEFLLDGCSTSLGCLFWAVMGFLILACLVL